MTRKIMAAGIVTIQRFGWMPIVVFLAHEICAHVVDGYRRWPPVDIPLHLAGGFAIAFFISGAVSTFGAHHLLKQPDWITHLAVVFGLTCAAALFWEFAEWTADHTIGTHCQLGLDDTMGDMLNGLLGGIGLMVPLGIRMYRMDAANQAPEDTARKLADPQH
jgi:hypothetical protein